MFAKSLRAVLAFVLLFLLAAAAFSQPSTLHQRVDELDHELRRWLTRVGEQPETRELARRELAGFERHLDELERQAATLGDTTEPVQRKLQALHALAADLARATATSDAPAPPARHTRVARTESLSRNDAAPANDACADALPIGPGGLRTGTTAGATRDGVASCGSSALSPDVWYRLIGHTSGYLSLDTFGSGYDTVVSVHAGCPGTQANQNACNDDAHGVHSATDFYAQAGRDYWIRVSGFAGDTGAFELRVGTGGAITGRVSSASGEPLEAGWVRVYDQNGYSVRSDRVTGEFSFSGLEPGVYYLLARDFPDHVPELYGGLPCGSGCSPTDGTAVVVNSQDTVTGVDIELDEGGSVSGVATHDATGDPVEGIAVRLYDDQGARVRTAVTTADGAFEVGGLASGTYFAVAESSCYADQLHDGLPCPGGAPYGCDPTTGAPIEVTAGRTTRGVDFALIRLASISGRVTEAVSGDPIAGIEVTVRMTSGGPAYYAYTDDAGDYTVGGLPAGTYAAATDNYRGYVDELHSEKPCPGGAWFGCSAADGTPIAVAAEAAVTGVDFTLDRFGEITGTVTHAVTGDPISNLRLEIWNDTWRETSVYTDASGAFRVRLAPATYYAATDAGSFRNELFQELPCPGRPGSGCDPRTGTPIAVPVNATTAGIDFTLDPGGAISGTVTGARTGAPARYADLEIWDAAGARVGTARAGFSGDYSVRGLDGGSYFVTVDHSSYQAELHDDVACPGGPPVGCDPATGTPVEVVFNRTTAGVDFALDQLGAVAGTVTHAVTGDGIGGVEVRIWNDAGERIGVALTDSNGDYRARDLPAGAAYASAHGFAIVDELYDGRPCAGGCDPTTGTALAVALDSTVEDVDFAVDALGAISGRVTAADGGDAIFSAQVTLHDAAGQQLRYDWTDFQGRYEFRGLVAGSYHVAVSPHGYVGEVYDEVPCHAGCDVTTGTPIPANVNTVSDGIDFALDRRGKISGSVSLRRTGAPIARAGVNVWSAGGSYVTGTRTDDVGRYTVGDLLPGTYFVVATWNYGSTRFLDQLYLDLPCPGGAGNGCDPTTGTPVEVRAAATTANVDFLVDLLGSVTGNVLDENGEPIVGVTVELWDASRSRQSGALTGTDGGYELLGVPPGDYYLSTRNSLGYLDELHDDLPCLGGGVTGCDPTKGAPVTVEVEAATRVDFELTVFGGISGTVIDERTGDPLPGVFVDGWDQRGSYVTTAVTSAAGTYFLRVPPGYHYVSTRSADYIDEVYPGVACPREGCDPAAGEPVAVEPEGTAGIDLALGDGTLFVDGFESGDLASWSR